MFSLGKNLVFIDLRTFELVEGEKMKCEVILPQNEIRGEINEHFLPQTIYVTDSHMKAGTLMVP